MAEATKDIAKQKYLNFKEIAAYSLGLFGFQAIVGLLNSYQAEFDGSILGANVSVVAILILIAKIVSAVADPVVGNLVDRSKSKMGKFKSMIVYSIIPLLVFTAVVFIDVPFKDNKIATYIWIFGTYLIWSIAMAMGDVPSQGIAAALTPNPTERTNVVSISNTFKQVGFSACVVIVPIVYLIIPGGSKVFVKSGETDTPMIAGEYLGTAILTAILGCVLFALIPLLNKERVTVESGEKTTAKDMLFALKDNKPFMLVIVSYFLGFGRQMAMGNSGSGSYRYSRKPKPRCRFGYCNRRRLYDKHGTLPVAHQKIGRKKSLHSSFGLRLCRFDFLICSRLLLVQIPKQYGAYRFVLRKLVPYRLAVRCRNTYANDYDSGLRGLLRIQNRQENGRHLLLNPHSYNQGLPCSRHSCRTHLCSGFGLL